MGMVKRLPSPRDNGRVSQEVDPNPVPPLAILGNYFLLIGNPVLVPSPNSSGIVDTEHINVFDFKSSTLHLGSGT
jgi:hypothetical protein